MIVNFNFVKFQFISHIYNKLLVRTNSKFLAWKNRHIKVSIATTKKKKTNFLNNYAPKVNSLQQIFFWVH
jgi:hypothetical protein